MTQKECSKCKRILSVKNFWKINKYDGKYQSQCKGCSSVITKKWRVDNRDKAVLLGKRGNLKANYNMTVSEYTTIFEAQGGTCAICGGVGKRSLAVDHCHETGQWRGLLCDSCNNGLGRFRDNPDLLRRAADYLAHYQVIPD